MSEAVLQENKPYDIPEDQLGLAEEHEHDYAGDTKFGFWIYILSDCMLFATLFATFAVLSFSYAGQITPLELFDLNFVLVETSLLLFSSFTFGMAMLMAQRQDIRNLMLWLAITFLLGGGFLAMELYEFYHFSHEGATPQTSAYWSAFYALLATHGLHVFAGMVWMIVLVAHIHFKGLNEVNQTRLWCLSLFWHFLDIIWICVFSVVFLLGVLQ